MQRGQFLFCSVMDYESGTKVLYLKFYEKTMKLFRFVCVIDADCIENKDVCELMENYINHF